MRAATLFTTLHRNTQEWKQALNLTQHEHRNEHIPTQPHLNYIHTKTRNTNTL